MRFFLQSVESCAGSFRGRFCFAMAVALLQIAFRPLASRFGGPPLFRWRQFDPGAARLREADSDSLFGGSGAVLALPDVLHLFADEFAGLGGRRFPFGFVAFRASECF